MLVIKTSFGDFGHPKDLLHYMKDEDLTAAYVKVQYCFEDVFEKNMSFDDVSRWGTKLYQSGCRHIGGSN